MGEMWQDICQQRGEENWVVLEVQGDQVQGIAKGVGLDAMVEHLDDTKIQWAVINVIGVDQQDNVTSKRPKFVQINWVGPRVPAMKRMGALSGKAAITAVCKGVQVTMDSNDRTELTVRTIGKALLQCGGAHKPTHYDFGGGATVTSEELYS